MREQRGKGITILVIPNALHLGHPFHFGFVLLGRHF
jgi:hypothetical protein